MKQWLKKYWWFPICILFSILLPALVNIAFLKFNLKTGVGLNNVSWLGFWGSYLGGLLGTIAALIALRLTYQQQERYHQEAKESDRLRVLPVAVAAMRVREESQESTYSCITVDQNGGISSKTMNSRALVRQFEISKPSGTYLAHIEIKNIGLGPALDVSISTDGQYTNSVYSAQIGPLGIGDSKLCIFLFQQTQSSYSPSIAKIFSLMFIPLNVKLPTHKEKRLSHLVLQQPPFWNHPHNIRLARRVTPAGFLRLLAGLLGLLASAALAHFRFSSFPSYT